LLWMKQFSWFWLEANVKMVVFVLYLPVVFLRKLEKTGTFFQKDNQEIAQRSLISYSKCSPMFFCKWTTISYNICTSTVYLQQFLLIFRYIQNSCASHASRDLTK